MESKSTEDGANPISAIAIAVILSLAMVLTTFIIFIKSGAYTTVKQIQIGTSFARLNKIDGYDTTSSIKADDITQYQQELNKKLDSINDSKDFNQIDVSDKALGLQ